MFTPRTPRPFFYGLLLLASIASPNPGKAQFVKLQPLPVYETSLRQYHVQKIKSAVQEFKAITRKKWWYYLPNIGFQFGLPSVQFGTSLLVQIDVDKQRNQTKLTSLITQGLLEYRTELHQLRNMYEALKVERDAIAQIPVTHKIENNIFSVAEEAHQKKEIKPVEYYQALLTYQRELLAGDARERAFALQIIEVARFARYEFPNETLPELDSLQERRPANEVTKLGHHRNSRTK